MDFSKRYLLFMGDDYYPNPGLGDFVLSSDEIPTLLRRTTCWGYISYLSLDLLESNRLVYFNHPKWASSKRQWHYKDKIDSSDEYNSKVDFAAWYEVYDASDLSNLVEVEPKIVDISVEELKELQGKYTYMPE
jgi:hypothetical protein